MKKVGQSRNKDILSTCRIGGVLKYAVVLSLWPFQICSVFNFAQKEFGKIAMNIKNVFIIMAKFLEFSYLRHLHLKNTKNRNNKDILKKTRKTGTGQKTTKK